MSFGKALIACYLPFVKFCLSAVIGEFLPLAAIITSRMIDSFRLHDTADGSFLERKLFMYTSTLFDLGRSCMLYSMIHVFLYSVYIVLHEI
jgi:hypothetical protein